MQSFTINISNPKLTDKVIWLLEHFKEDGLEIVSNENLNDLMLLKKRGGSRLFLLVIT